VSSPRRNPERRVRERLVAGLMVLGLWLPPTGVAMAEDSADPTRPPRILPTAPDRTDADEDTGLRLHGVFGSDGQRVALINARRVREQDRIGSARILRIERDAVHLQRGSETLVLELAPPDIKREPGREESP